MNFLLTIFLCAEVKAQEEYQESALSSEDAAAVKQAQAHDLQEKVSIDYRNTSAENVIPAKEQTKAQQERRVTGTVKDENGETLPGVTMVPSTYFDSHYFLLSLY
ncbi:MAG: hypothetical protein WD426_11030 [Anditalea sp.]